jgi:hypothetical protein
MFISFGVMFIVDSESASISSLIASVLFITIHLQAPSKTMSWSGLSQSLIYHQGLLTVFNILVRKYLLRLGPSQHVKFWRPQILFLVHSPLENYLLIKFLNDLKKGGLFVLGSVLKGEFSNRINDYKSQLPAWNRFVELGGIKAFCDLVIAKTERIGAQNLLLNSGLGGIKPNIIIMGFFNSRKDLPHFTDSSSSSIEGLQDQSAHISSAQWQNNRPTSHYVNSRKASPLLRPFKQKSKTRAKNIPQEIRDDPICFTDLPCGSDGDGISVESYVGIIEDALMSDKVCYYLFIIRPLGLQETLTHSSNSKTRVARQGAHLVGCLVE